MRRHDTLVVVCRLGVDDLGSPSDRRGARPAIDGIVHRGVHVRVAVLRVRLGGADDAGDRDERAVAVPHLRRVGVDLPEGGPVRAAAVHPDGLDRADDVDPDAGDRIRPVDGLRSLLAVRVRERSDITAGVGSLQRTGGEITRLALVLIVMVDVFSAPGGRFIKLTGIGMIVGAFIAGMLLVPAMTAQDSVPGLAGGPGNVIECQGRPGGTASRRSGWLVRGRGWPGR